MIGGIRIVDWKGAGVIPAITAVTIPSFVGYSHIPGPGAGMGARDHVSCLVV